MLPEDNYFKIYYHKDNMFATAANLIHFGLRQILQTTHLKDLEELKEILLDDGKLREQMDEQRIKKLTKFIFEAQIDAIRISIGFENLIKAILLCNGYLVHVVDREKCKKVNEQQKKAPLKLKEFLKSYPFIRDESKGYQVIPNLSFKTLSFGIISGKNYQEIVKIPDEIMKTVLKYYKKRNQIHFYHVDAGEYGLKSLDELEKLKRYCPGVMVELNNRINKILKGPEHHYIDPSKLFY